MKKFISPSFVVIVIAVAAFTAFNRKHASSAVAPAKDLPVTKPVIVAETAASTEATVTEIRMEPVPTPVESQPVAKPQKNAAKNPKLAKQKELTQDPDARAALGFVGADPVAEAYWVAAINDPNLPANERKDLIEDLNEDGLSNAKQATSEDLPLILNRLRLIENLAPDAMDSVNADAFAEAYKDLSNLARGGTAQ